MFRLLILPWFALLPAWQSPALPPDPTLLILGEQYPEAQASRLITQAWHGLFLTQGAARVAPVRLTFGERSVGCTDDDVIVDLRSDVSGASYAVLSRVVPAGPATSVRMSYPALLSGGNALLSSGGEQEIPLALGNRRYGLRLEFAKEDLTDARVTLTEGRTSQELFAAEGFVDEPHFTLHWAGDLDRDGRLDLIVTLSHKYSVFPTRLLLSSAARRAELVGTAAMLERTAC